MSVIVSDICGNSYKEFSKELFTKVSDNLKSVPDTEIANLGKAKEVLVSVYIRTDKDNLVLVLDEESSRFSNVSSITDFTGLYPNFLPDRGLLCGKNLIERVFSVRTEEAIKRLIGNSTCFPVGAVETKNHYVAVFNIVISSSILTDPEIVLNEGFYFHPIETIKPKDSLQREISKSLVIVKESEV